MDYRQAIEIENELKRQIRAYFPDRVLRDESGIYVYTRDDESGLRFAYVGQAKKVLTRLAQHSLGYKAHNPSHIDLSLKKRGFYEKEDRPYSWRVFAIYFDERELNEMERFWIVKVGNGGYQLLNKTSGGQDGGKVGIAPNRPARGYRDGLKQGYENARKEIAPLFEKYLEVSKKNAGRKDAEERALQKFFDFIKKL